MTDEPRHRLRRRSPIQVEPLEGRALLSAVKATTPPGQAQLVISPSSPNVNQQQGSFTVTLYLKKEYNRQGVATLDEPLTVDFSASIEPPGSVTPESASPAFAPFHAGFYGSAGGSFQPALLPLRRGAEDGSGWRVRGLSALCDVESDR